MNAVEIPIEDLQIGDHIIGWRWQDTSGSWRWSYRDVGTCVKKLDTLIQTSEKAFLVRNVIDCLRIKPRAGVAPSTATSSGKIPDWPISCPRCKRNESAVLLFSNYDCRHGCFR